jgi:hypothetical protein
MMYAKAAAATCRKVFLAAILENEEGGRVEGKIYHN